MVENVQLFAYGAAAVLDLVVLLSLLERPNWQYIAVWMLMLTVGVWMWHTGVFIHALLAHSTGDLALQALWVSMVVMAVGLLMMPSAMLHGLHRFTRSGLGVSICFNPWLGLYYLPVLLSIPIGLQLATAPGEPFLDLLKDYSNAYLTWMSGTNLVVAVGLWRLQANYESPSVLRFFRSMAWTLLGITLLNVSCLTWGLQVWSDGRVWWQMIVALSPVFPTLLFAYFVLRFQLLPLVLERTLTYGAIVVGAMLLHEIVTHDLATALQAQYRVNFGLMEGVAALGLILIYQPLRQRVTEALRYLFGSPAQHRDQNRRLSVQLASQSGERPQELLSWFAQAARQTFEVEYVTAVLFEAEDQDSFQTGHEFLIPVARARWLCDQLRAADLRTCTLYDAPNRATLDVLQEAGASAVLRIDYPGQDGLLLIGPQRFRQSLGNEELNALSLLVEQLGATLHNGHLQAARLEAERRATQQEKLSSLGLIAGSIAHEVKNPLSSIKAIATVLAEELGSESPHSEDLRFILAEIDRLAMTTSQLLEIAREPPQGQRGGQLQTSLTRTVQLLSQFARQQHVRLTIETDQDLPFVNADEGTLREIFFNLIANSIEAAGSGGDVSVSCHRDGQTVMTTVHDTGPGLPTIVQQRLFEPLVTTKEKGTGLGLYIVGVRVRGCGGEITFETGPKQGTSFFVRLPFLPEDRTDR